MHQSLWKHYCIFGRTWGADIMPWEMGTLIVPNYSGSSDCWSKLLRAVALHCSPEPMREKNPSGPRIYYCLSLKITSCSHSWLRVTLASGFCFVSRGTVDVRRSASTVEAHDLDPEFLIWWLFSRAGISLCYSTWYLSKFMTNDEIILVGFSFIPIFLMF